MADRAGGARRVAHTSSVRQSTALHSRALRKCLSDIVAPCVVAAARSLCECPYSRRAGQLEPPWKCLRPRSRHMDRVSWKCRLSGSADVFVSESAISSVELREASTGCYPAHMLAHARGAHSTLVVTCWRPGLSPRHRLPGCALGVLAPIASPEFAAVFLTARCGRHHAYRRSRASSGEQACSEVLAKCVQSVWFGQASQGHRTWLARSGLLRDL